MTDMPQSSNPDRVTASRGYLFMLAVIAIAIVLNALIPPMQSPDEPAHLGRAYLLSKGQIFLDNSPEGMGGYVDDGLLRFMDIFFELGVHGKMDATLTNGVVPLLHWADTSSHRAYTGTAYYFPAIYAPQAIALAVSEALGLSISHSYALARLAVFLAVAALVAAAAALVRPSALALAILLMPMTVFQAISSTIDALSLGLCMLSISCFLVLLKAERHKRDGVLFTTLCVAVFLLASSRAYALPLLLLPIAVAWKRRSQHLICAGIVVAILAVGWTLFAIATIHDDRVPRALSTMQILGHYGSHPGAFLQVLANTLKAKVGFYVASFIGQLGYLNIPLPQPYRVAAGGMLCFLAILSLSFRAAFDGENLGRVILAVLAIPACFIVFLAMLATWTPFPNAVIEGVQGRYFHIPALMLAYAIAGTHPWGNKARDFMAAIVLAGFVAMGASVTASALLNRYWAQDSEVAVAPAKQSSKKVPLTMQSGDVLSGSRVSPGDGALHSVALGLGTFFGRSNGDLMIEVCADECGRGTLDVVKAVDNQLTYIPLGRPVKVSQGSPLRYRVVLSRDATRPVVIWSYVSKSVSTEVSLNGQQSDLEPEMRLAIR